MRGLVGKNTPPTNAAACRRETSNKASHKKRETGAGRKLERVAGIEPAYSAWKAAALPLCYTRANTVNSWLMVEEVGFEPT